MSECAWSPGAEAEPPPANAECAAQPDGDMAAAYARCFATPDGQRVLAHLRRRTFARICGPDAPEALLRHAEGQRHLVASIIALARRGGRATLSFQGEPGEIEA